jgi:hypothetical protein
MAKFGITDAQWDAVKEEIRVVLLKRVNKKIPIYYSDLVAEVHTVKLRAKDPALDTLLDEISREEDAAGRGMLSVVVIRKPPEESLPGSGFFKLAKKLGRDTSDRNTCWAEEIAKVYSHSE